MAPTISSLGFCFGECSGYAKKRKTNTWKRLLLFSSPKGPMRISDIDASGCTVTWSPPEDDGGSPVTHYAVEKTPAAATSWTQCGRVDASAGEESISYRVTGLVEGKEYRLQVTI